MFFKESKWFNGSLSRKIWNAINKFRDELNSMIKTLEKKLRSMVTSHQNNILSLMDSFEKEMNDIIDENKWIIIGVNFIICDK